MKKEFQDILKKVIETDYKDNVSLDNDLLIFNKIGRSVLISEKLLEQDMLLKLRKIAHDETDENAKYVFATIFDLIVKALNIFREEQENVISFPKTETKDKDLVYSFSKRQVFIDSPRDYFYNYVYSLDGVNRGIQRIEKKDALFAGGVFHELLDTYYTAKQFKHSSEEAFKMALTEHHLKWNDSCKDMLNDKHKELLNDSLIWFEHYHYNFKDNDFEEVVFAEVSFLSELYTFEELKDYRFLQHIKADLLVKDKGHYKLVEHKTFAQERTELDRVSPQTLEYVKGIEKDLGITIKSVIFNEIRKATPKGATYLKSGKLSESATALSNLSKMRLDIEYENGIITSEEDYKTLLKYVNMDYYFKRVEFPIVRRAVEQFSNEMKNTTLSLAKSMVNEYNAKKENKLIEASNYPLNWTLNRKFPSEYIDIYLAILQGEDEDTINSIITSRFEPKTTLIENVETPKEKIERLANMLKEVN